MNNSNTQKYIGFLVIIIVIVGGGFLLKSKKVDAPVVDNTEVKDNNTPEVVPKKPIPSKPTTSSSLTSEQKVLLAKLQQTALARDYEAFADVLLEVYKKEWVGVDDFKKVESEFYVYTTDKYWKKGDLVNSLKLSTIVYNKVPEAWRFRYIRILVLEKYGRNAFDSGDLASAENYANTILQMMFRPEGANLMGDIYISKINTNIKNGDLNTAKQNLNFIWDYEVSADRRAKLEGLKTQLGL